MLGGAIVTGGVGANDVVVAVVDVMGKAEVGAAEVGAAEVGAAEVGAAEVGAAEVGAAEVGATRVCGFFVVAGIVGGDGGVGVGGKGDASKISTESKMGTVFLWHERLKEFENTD
jgi:hypothetical protein